MNRNTTANDDAQTETVRVYANDLKITLVAAWKDSEGTSHGFRVFDELGGKYLSNQAVDSQHAAENFVHVNDVVTPETRVVNERTVEDLGVQDTVEVDGERYEVEFLY